MYTLLFSKIDHLFFLQNFISAYSVPYGLF